MGGGGGEVVAEKEEEENDRPKKTLPIAKFDPPAFGRGPVSGNIGFLELVIWIEKKPPLIC